MIIALIVVVVVFFQPVGRVNLNLIFQGGYN